MDANFVIDVLAILKVIIAIWSLIFVIGVYHYIKKALYMIPKAVFTKGRDGIHIAINIPKKTIKLVGHKIKKGKN